MSRQVVIALVFNDQREILIIERTKPVADQVLLKWAFPGGGLEGDEGPDAGVIREVLEETGYAIKNPKHLSTRRHLNDDVDLHYYEAELEHGQQADVSAIEEVGQVCWIKLDRLGEIFTSDLMSWLKSDPAVAKLLDLN